MPAQLVPWQHPLSVLCLSKPHPPATFRHHQKLTAASRSSPRQPRAVLTLYCDKSMSFGNSPSGQASRTVVMPSGARPTPRGTGQSGAETSPLQGNDPSFHLSILSMMEKKKSVKKNPTKNLEEGYPALTGLSTLGLRPGQTKWTLARWLLPKPICSSESCFFCCWMETKVLLILHGMALWVNLIKNNLGLRTKINVCAAGGKGTNSCNTEQRAMHQTRWANHRKDHGTNAKADIGMGSKKLKRWRGKGGGTEP